MPPLSAASAVETLREVPLLSGAQLQEVAGPLGEQFPSASGLVTELLRRGWLTHFQADLLLEGKGRGLVLGPYVLLDVLGRGGMGEVYKARHLLLNRVVALKVARKDVLKDPSDEARFLREMQTTAQLAHPHIVAAYDAVRVEGTYVFAMELVEGTDLGRLVKQYGPLPVGLACEYVRQAALGLQHAHEHGLIHRDIKPSNLLLSADGTRVKVSDLGLVRQHDDDGQLTTPGLVIGTPDYLAPEQARDSRHVDIRSDLYSLGCTLYHLLGGQAPFAGYKPLEKLLKHVEEEPTPLQQLRASIPDGVAAAVRRLMAKQPADRYQTPAEAAEALAPFSQLSDSLCPLAEGRPDPSSPPPEACNWPDSDGPTWRPAQSTPPPQAAVPRPEAGPVAPPAPAAPPPPPAEAAPAPPPAAAPASPAETAPKPPAEAPKPAPPEEPAPRWLTRRRVLVAAAALALAGAGLVYWQPWATGRGSAKAPVTNSLGMELVWVPAGAFTMGSPDDEPGRREDEGPTHAVTLTTPFYLASHETTVAQFRAFAQLTKYQTEAERDGRGARRWDEGRRAWVQDRACTWRTPGWQQRDEEPVVGVTRYDALAFCYWLGKKEGRAYRLPTEAEWEHACRAGKGGAPAPAAAEGPARRTHPAGSLPANAWGLVGMQGNVWEWCADSYAPTYYRDSPARDPRGPEQGDLGLLPGVLRGGSWQAGAADCRPAARLGAPLDTCRTDVGFRVVLEAVVR